MHVLNSLAPSDATWLHKIKTGSSNGLLLDGTKSLPYQSLIYYIDVIMDMMAS